MSICQNTFVCTWLHYLQRLALVVLIWGYISEYKVSSSTMFLLANVTWNICHNFHIVFQRELTVPLPWITLTSVPSQLMLLSRARVNYHQAHFIQNQDDRAERNQCEFYSIVLLLTKLMHVDKKLRKDLFKSCLYNNGDGGIGFVKMCSICTNSFLSSYYAYSWSLKNCWLNFYFSMHCRVFLRKCASSSSFELPQLIS